MSTEDYLEQYYSDIEMIAINPKLASLRLDGRNAIATMQLGVERILDKVHAHNNLAKAVITMIGLFDAKDITGDLAISCAEVALEDAGVPVSRLINYTLNQPVLLITTYIWLAFRFKVSKHELSSFIRNRNAVFPISSVQISALYPCDVDIVRRC